jgi:hypothetical protein
MHGSQFPKRLAPAKTVDLIVRAQPEEPTIAGAILDCTVHNATCIDLSGKRLHRTCSCTAHKD